MFELHWKLPTKTWALVNVLMKTRFDPENVVAIQLMIVYLFTSLNSSFDMRWIRLVQWVEIFLKGAFLYTCIFISRLYRIQEQVSVLTSGSQLFRDIKASILAM